MGATIETDLYPRGVVWLIYMAGSYIFIVGQIFGLILFVFSYSGYLQGNVFGFSVQKFLICIYFFLVLLLYLFYFWLYKVGSFGVLRIYDAPFLLSPALLMIIYSIYFVDWQKMLYKNDFNYLLFNYAALVCWSAFWVVFVAFSKINWKRPAQ